MLARQGFGNQFLNNDFCNFGDMSFFMKKTKAAPSMVPNNGIKRPKVMPMMIIDWIVKIRQTKTQAV